MIDTIHSLLQVFNPTFIEVIDESSKHSRGKYSHFKIVVVSKHFEELPLIQCHQKVYQALESVINNPIHGLVIHTFSPDNWSKESVWQSADCRGGSK